MLAHFGQVQIAVSCLFDPHANYVWAPAGSSSSELGVDSDAPETALFG